jgi:hypothetical protein
MPPTVLTASKTTPEAQTKPAMRMLCQTDLYAFARRVLYAHLTPNLLTDTLHKPLCAWMQTTRYDENLYLLSRGFFKSSIITTAAVIQRILADPATWWCQQRWHGRVCGPNTRILLASNKGENAEGFLAGIKGHLSGNDLLLGLFPEILPRDPARAGLEWTQGAITVQRSRRDLRESTIQTIGVEGELVSRHYDGGVFDDCVGKENSGTKAERAKVWDFFMKARPLFDPGATKEFVGTHWHYADAYAAQRARHARGQLPMGIYIKAAWEKTTPRTADDPAVRDGVVGDVPGHGWVAVSFPERFCLRRPPGDTTRLELLVERDNEPSNFNAQYLLNPVSAETAHFPRLDPTGAPNLQLERAAPPLSTLWVAMAIDPAQSLHKWADHSGIAVGGFDHRGDLWLLELWMARRDDEALVRKVFDLVEHFQARGAPMQRIGFEATGFQKGMRHVFTNEGDRRGFYLPILGLERDTQRTKQQRIGLIQGPWMAKQIHALESCEALADFIDQADKFRMDQENESDDLLDPVADLYQLRGKPNTPAVAASWADPEVLEQRAWEAQVLAARAANGQGGLDRMSLLIGWQQHRARQAERTLDPAALGQLDPQLLEIGR